MPMILRQSDSQLEVYELNMIIEGSDKVRDQI